MRSAHVVAFLVASLPNGAGADPLRVRGMPTFRALQTQPTADGGYRVVGYVRDAFDQPLDGLVVQLVAPEGQPCEAESDQTGPDGEFCFRVRATTGEQVHLAVAASKLLDSVSRIVALDPTASSLKLALEPSSTELLLEQTSHALKVTLDGAPGDEPYPVKVRLERPGEANAARRQRTKHKRLRCDLHFRHGLPDQAQS
jgi:hypothetical protein